MLVRRIARPLLASVFVVTGLDALRNPGARTAATTHLLEQVPTPASLPDDPALLVRVNGGILLAGGALLATGHLPRLASTLLAGSLIPTTAIEHAFWEETDPDRKKQSRSLFLKNVGLLGGLLLAAVDTEGRPSLAWRAKHAGQRTGRELKQASRSAKREAKQLARSAQDVVS
ncbi:MAG: DoxX family protein [Intrasporangium sp.]|uniref:DoxX family protein n=1 Tax=Intrasporangium sp. TaxID=1925024 RepID=UPI0026489735|nr:DoxX family protein [Intrasporangium sp.]MDN5796117.1 DoxX family protein [Intrasporangium sp.]